MKDINATIIIGLKGKTREEIYRGTDYSRRKNIKKAIKSGITYKESKDEKDLKKGYKINSKILLEGGTVPKNYVEWLKFIDPERNPYFVIKYKESIIGCFAIRGITRKFYGENSNEKKHFFYN